MRCCYNATGFWKNPYKRHPIARYGVSFVNSNSDLYSLPLSAVMYAKYHVILDRVIMTPVPVLGPTHNCLELNSEVHFKYMCSTGLKYYCGLVLIKQVPFSLKRFSSAPQILVSEWVINFNGLSHTARSIYKPCNHSLNIDIIIFPHIDSTQSTSHN